MSATGPTACFARHARSSLLACRATRLRFRARHADLRGGVLMAFVDWSMKGPELATCNCDWGCPCQFNALPTHGNCRAAVAMRIDQGYFADTKLDGVKVVEILAWP